MYALYTSVHLPVIAIALNECTSKLESSSDTSAQGLYTQYEWQHMKAGCAHTYTHPLSICHAYPPCAYKTLSSTKKQLSPFAELNSAKHRARMNKYLVMYKWLSVLILVNVS